MKLETAIFQAAILGTLAFKSGKITAPCQDAELLKVIGSISPSEFGGSISVLKAWIQSFDAARLA